MPKSEAVAHIQAFKAALQAVSRIPMESRGKAIVAAWHRHGMPVQRAFHEVGGLRLQVDYRCLLRLYASALQRLVSIERAAHV